MSVEMLKRLRELKETNQIVVSNRQTAKSKPLMTVDEALSRLGYTSFRTGQREIIDEVLKPDSEILAVCRTGYGKSLFYQLPALLFDGVTIIVSPLIALMKDQSDKLNKLALPAGFVNSSQTPKQKREAMEQIAQGDLRIIFVSPERFEDDDFISLLQAKEISLMAIDEAHCISQWGHDFRKSYSRLGKVRESLRPKRIIALTATATKKVQDSIVESLGMVKPSVFIRGVYRENLEIMVVEGLGYARLHAVKELVDGAAKDGDATGIIYAVTQKKCEETFNFLEEHGYNVTKYHGGMKDKERTAIQDKWSSNGGIIVATSAFGMGIDRPDVRFCINLGLCGSIEEWFQMIGRAGRDGKPSVCATLWDRGHERYSDYWFRMLLIDFSNPIGSEIKDFGIWARSRARQVAEAGAKSALLEMTQKDMSIASGCTGISTIIGFLSKHGGLIRKEARGKYRVRLDAELPSDDELKELDKRRARKIAKVDAFEDFLLDDECRAKAVCEYFGETLNSGCGKCDNCNP